MFRTHRNPKKRIARTPLSRGIEVADSAYQPKFIVSGRHVLELEFAAGVDVCSTVPIAATESTTTCLASNAERVSTSPLTETLSSDLNCLEYFGGKWTQRARNCAGSFTFESGANVRQRVGSANASAYVVLCRTRPHCVIAATLNRRVCSARAFGDRTRAAMALA
jgi:hypothetical protein